MAGARGSGQDRTQALNRIGEPIAHRFVVQLSAYPITFRQTRNPCRASRDTQRI
jgi:hypothetical protein